MNASKYYELYNAEFAKAKQLIECDNLTYLDDHSHHYPFLCKTHALHQQELHRYLLDVYFKRDLFEKCITLPLHTSIIAGDLATFKYLFANINTIEHGHTVLHSAIGCGNVELVQLLYQNGVDVNWKYDNNYYPLHIAAAIGYKDMVCFLLQRGALVNMQDMFGDSALSLAVKGGYLNVVLELLKYKPSANILSKSLKYAFSRSGDVFIDIIEALLKYIVLNEHPTVVCEVLNHRICWVKNGQNCSYTLLQSIAIRKQTKLMKLLISYNVDVNARDDLGRTALHFFNIYDECPYKCPRESFAWSKVDCAELLLKNGADINAQDNLGCTPLHYAAKNGHIELLTILLLHNADLNIKDKNGWTPLHEATAGFHGFCVKVLIENGAEINCKTNNNETPLHICAKKPDTQFLTKILLDYGADINATDINGNTALHIASDKQNHFQMLLDYEADINVINNNNETCCKYDTDRFFMIHFIVRLVFQRLEVNEQNLAVVQQWFRADRTKTLIEMIYCVWEIRNMSGEVINHTNITFNDFILKDIPSIVKLIQNKHVLEALETSRYASKYPLHALFIKCKLTRALLRKRLVEDCHKISHIIYPFLPHICVAQILSHLGNIELIRLMVAAEPQGKSLQVKMRYNL